MLQSERVQKALDAVEDCCGKCAVCSPDCPIEISKRALTGLLYDLKTMEESDGASDC